MHNKQDAKCCKINLVHIDNSASEFQVNINFIEEEKDYIDSLIFHGINCITITLESACYYEQIEKPRTNFPVQLPCWNENEI